MVWVLALFALEDWQFRQQHEAGYENEAAAYGTDVGYGQSVDEVECCQRCEHAANSGEEGVDGHVVGHSLCGGEFCDPESPCHVASGVGDAVDCGSEEEACDAIGGEESQDTDGESQVEDHAEHEEVHAIEEPAPEGAEEESGGIGDNADEEGDFGGGQGEVVFWVGEVFDAHG